MAICADLQDGKLDGSYTQAQWNAFISDPTVQGYCSVIVPPCVYQGQSGSGGSECQAATSATKTTTKSKTAPVALTPKPAPRVAVVKGATHTSAQPHAPLATITKKGTLPFTGVQLSLVLAVGLALIGAGVALRLTGRAPDHS